MSIVDFLKEHNLSFRLKHIESHLDFPVKEGLLEVDKYYLASLVSNVVNTDCSIHVALGFPKFEASDSDMIEAVVKLFEPKTLKVDRMDSMAPYTIQMIELPFITRSEVEAFVEIYNECKKVYVPHKGTR